MNMGVSMISRTASSGLPEIHGLGFMRTLAEFLGLADSVQRLRENSIRIRFRR